MTTIQEIVKSIDTRLRTLNDELKTLEAARVALDGRDRKPSPRPSTTATDEHNAATRANARSKASAKSKREASADVVSEPASRPPKRARRPSRPRARRTSTDIPADRLESLLSANGGLTTSTLAEQSGGNRDQVLKLLRELEAAGRIRRTGQRRATRWHAITDEDRIRERAEELEATRKRRA
jgi:hypothetical protein